MDGDTGRLAVVMIDAVAEASVATRRRMFSYISLFLGFQPVFRLYRVVLWPGFLPAKLVQGWNRGKYYQIYYNIFRSTVRRSFSTRNLFYV